jgi:HlyD family secretion protein
MPRKWLQGPRLLTLLVVLSLAATAWFLQRKPPLPVDVATVARGPMAVTVDDLGETRVSDLYTVSAPVTGELLRIPLKAGAAVVADRTIVAEIKPGRPEPVNARSYAQTRATISGLEAQHAAAEARVREMRAAVDLAAADFSRVTRLATNGFVAAARVDQSRIELTRSRAALREAVQAADAAMHAVEAARASLENGREMPRDRIVRVTAPISGSVLRVLQQSGRPVLAGTALLDLGDPAQLEVVADLLSTDAVKVQPGAEVAIDAWGGEAPLRGVVRLVEPYGFTKVSALGVEEQRVNVVIDFADTREARRLGHGYRVTVHIDQWSAADALRLPLGALFRDGANWAVYVVDPELRARRQTVGIGHRNDDVAEVLSGLTAGQRVILHPSDKLSDGMRISERR